MTVLATSQITIVELNDGDIGPAGPQGVPGPSGSSLYTWIKYADDSVGTNMQNIPDGKTYMGIAYNKTESNESNNPADYTWSKIEGPQGIQGPTGPDGQPTFTWIKYGDDANGLNMSDSPTGKKYLGIAYNKSTTLESSVASDYTWSLIQGPKGTDGQNAITGILSNESHVVPTDSAGNNGNFTGASTVMSIYNGASDDSANWTVTAVPTNVTGSLSGKTYTVTAMSADTGYVTLTAARSGYASVVKKFSLSKGKQGGAGGTGSPATAYWLVNSVSVISKSATGAYTPSSITVTGKSQTGSNAPADYAARFILAETTDGTTFTDKYTSAANEVSKVYSPTAGIKALRVRMYLAGGTSSLLDEQVIPIVTDGTNGYTPVKGTDYFDGQPGKDGTSSYLWIRYSQNADGSGMTTSPANALYIGTATTTTATAPSVNTSYNWSLIKGTDGQRGEPGDDGQTSYLHIKYSNDGGATFTANSGETVGEWIGTYVDFTVTDSTSVSAYTWNKVKGDKGDPGNDAVIGVLSNESHTIPTDVNGNSGNFTGANTTISIYKGGADDSANWTYSVVVSNVTGSLSSRTYTVTALSADTGYVDITATRSGFASLTKRFTLSKSKQGAVGSSATTYWLVNSVPAIQKDANGVYTPTSISVTGKSQTGTGTPANYSGRFVISDSTDGTNFTARYTSAANEATKSYTPSAGIKALKVQLYLAGGTTTLLDEQTIPIVSDGSKGDKGDPGTPGNSYYTWIKYADSPTTGMSDSPTGKTYIGIAHNKTVSSESSTYSDYTWSLIKGDKGDKGELAGRNIFRGSFADKFTSWNSALVYTPTNDINSVKATYSGTGSYFGFSSVAEHYKTEYELNKIYTLSFEVRGTVTNMSYTYMMRNDGTNSSFGTVPVTLSTTTWTTVELTKTGPWSTLQGYLLIGSMDVVAGKWFEVRKIQIEEGTEATQWVPNPIDIQVKAEGTEKKINNAVTTIDETGINVKDGNFTLSETNGGSIPKYNLAVTNNLLNDHSFEMMNVVDGTYSSTYDDWQARQVASSPFTWITLGSPRIVINGELDTPSAIFGDRSVQVNSQNYVWQTVKAKQNTTYTISGYFTKGSRGVTSSVPRIRVYIQKGTQYIDDEGGWTQVSVHVTPPAINVGDYPNKAARHAVTLTTPTLSSADITAGYTLLRLKIEINGVTTNWVMADGIQCVESDIPAIYMPETSLWRMRRGADSTAMFSADSLNSYGDMVGLTVHTDLDFGSGHGGDLIIDPALRNQYGMPPKNMDIIQVDTTSNGGLTIRSALDTTGVAGHLWSGTGGFVIDSYYGDMSGGRNVHIRTGGFESFVVRYNSNTSLSFANASNMFIIGDSGGDGELMRLEGDTHTYMTFYKGSTRLGWVGDGSTSSDNITLWGLNDVNIAPSNGPNFAFSSVSNGGIDFGQTKVKFLYSTGTVQARNSADSAYVPMNASAFTVNSERKVKRGIRKMERPALDLVMNTPIYNYQLEDEFNIYQGKKVIGQRAPEEVKVRTGLVHDEAPEELIHCSETIDLYAMNSLLWKAVQELTEEMRFLKKRFK